MNDRKNQSARVAEANAPARRNDRAATERDEIDAFLEKVEAAPVAGSGRGRLIFAIDATASRQPTWDRAMALQGDMFVQTRGIGSLDVQLVYYRGYRECRATRWLKTGEQLLALMRKVSCEAGRTQIARVLKHALAETDREPVQALIFIGDSVEEAVDELGDLAGQLRLKGLPVFVFQEGHDPGAATAFAAVAKLSGGAHCRFDERSATRLGELLNAVAVYATGGRRALERLSRGSVDAARLLEQLDP